MFHILTEEFLQTTAMQCCMCGHQTGVDYEHWSFQCVMKNTMDLAVPYEVTVAQTGPPLCVNHLRNVQIWKHYIIMLQPPKENNHHGDAFTFDCVNGQVKWYIVPSKYCDKDST